MMMSKKMMVTVSSTDDGDSRVFDDDKNLGRLVKGL